MRRASTTAAQTATPHKATAARPLMSCRQLPAGAGSVRSVVSHFGNIGDLSGDWRRQCGEWWRTLAGARSITSVSAGVAGRIFSSLTARRSISCGRRSVSSSRRSCRLTSASCVRAWRSSSIWRLVSTISKCCHAEKSSMATISPASRACRMNSRRCVRSTSRTTGLFRMSFLMAYSTSMLMPPSPRPASLALRARGLRAISSSPGTTGRRVTSDTVAAGGAAAERVLDDPVLERVERDDRQPAAGREDGDGAAPGTASSPSSSPFTQIRSA